MKLYIDTIEQTMTKEEEQITALNEYGKREAVSRSEGDTDDEYMSKALSKYYKKLSDVSADIGVNHTYMLINITDSSGIARKHDVLGTYLESIPVEPEPESEPSEE